jgi:S1-C subfamily serine protease
MRVRGNRRRRSFRGHPSRACGRLVGIALGSGLVAWGVIAHGGPIGGTSAAREVGSSGAPLGTELLSDGSPPVALASASSIDAASIAAKVDPAIVDITSTLSNGIAEGTGMVITPGCQVLTNNHVIEGSTRVTGRIDGTGPIHPMRIIGADRRHDVALLQIEGASNCTTVILGDSSTVALGDQVLAIGNALGRGGTPAIAAGQVVALGRTITATDEDGSNPETLGDMIETDADIQPGDSGGPLLNASGQVIGMDTAGSSADDGTPTDGFAIPIADAMAVVGRLRGGK